MSYTRVNYTDIEPVSGAMHTLRDPLDSKEVGVTIARCEPEWRNRLHDHADSDHEEIYILMEGRATVIVDDEPVEMESGDAIRIPPASTRQIRNGETESAFVLVSAPASRCITAAETTDDDDSWAADGFVG
ncbi:cupin domain-containing protein [Halalkalirubrum salinum]|uniref:cupin domain-containing protein n=1 Tax=Halalkalirubrum salinum TaxID=2563889 RepID=UPI0010FAED30|nr:cupin domain-containing protein [Halalkalirubrum salinum]